MRKNAIVNELGLFPNARVVVFHADDVRMCHATLEAYADSANCGLVSSASVMVTSLWFPEMSAMCRKYGSLADKGVHLTLTSEWPSYRRGLPRIVNLGKSHSDSGVTNKRSLLSIGPPSWPQSARKGMSSCFSEPICSGAGIA